jgi:hypothetical protein
MKKLVTVITYIFLIHALGYAGEIPVEVLKKVFHNHILTIEGNKYYRVFLSFKNESVKSFTLKSGSAIIDLEIIKLESDGTDEVRRIIDNGATHFFLLPLNLRYNEDAIVDSNLLPGQVILSNVKILK